MGIRHPFCGLIISKLEVFMTIRRRAHCNQRRALLDLWRTPVPRGAEKLAAFLALPRGQALEKSMGTHLIFGPYFFPSFGA